MVQGDSRTGKRFPISSGGLLFSIKLLALFFERWSRIASLQFWLQRWMMWQEIADLLCQSAQAADRYEEDLNIFKMRRILRFVRIKHTILLTD